MHVKDREFKPASTVLSRLQHKPNGLYRCYRCLDFARTGPKLAAGPVLSWVDKLALTLLEDNDLRIKFECEAVQNRWTHLVNGYEAGSQYQELTPAR